MIEWNRNTFNVKSQIILKQKHKISKIYEKNIRCGLTGKGPQQFVINRSCTGL